MRRMAPVNLIVYYPKTKEGRMDLATRVAQAHAAAAIAQLKRLNCPTRQKLALLDAVIDTVRKREQERT